MITAITMFKISKKRYDKCKEYMTPTPCTRPNTGRGAVGLAEHRSVRVKNTVKQDVVPGSMGIRSINLKSVYSCCAVLFLLFFFVCLCVCLPLALKGRLLAAVNRDVQGYNEAS